MIEFGDSQLIELHASDLVGLVGPGEVECSGNATHAADVVNMREPFCRSHCVVKNEETTSSDVSHSKKQRRLTSLTQKSSW